MRTLVASKASGNLPFSGIFDKVGSSEIVNILQDLTFGFLTSHFVGGAQRRPLILRVSARFARGQAEVRNPLRFLYLLCPKKNFCYKDKQILSIEAQVTELRAFGKQNNLNIIEELVEKQSAKIPGRPIFGKMIKRIEKGEADGILA